MIRGGGYGPANPDGHSDVAFMLDQCHNIETKIPGQIRSVLNVQEMTARALLLDRDALGAAQEAGDVLAANEIFMDAYNTDVRSDLGGWREERGLPADPAPGLSRVRLPGADRGRPASAEPQAGWG